jgi:hypothetical protein
MKEWNKWLDVLALACITSCSGVRNWEDYSLKPTLVKILWEPIWTNKPDIVEVQL